MPIHTVLMKCHVNSFKKLTILPLFALLTSTRSKMHVYFTVFMKKSGLFDKYNYFDTSVFTFSQDFRLLIKKRHKNYLQNYKYL